MTMFGTCDNKLTGGAKVEGERRKIRQKRSRDPTFGYRERKAESKYLSFQQLCSPLVLFPQFLLHFTLDSMKYPFSFLINLFFT